MGVVCDKCVGEREMDVWVQMQGSEREVGAQWMITGRKTGGIARGRSVYRAGDNGMKAMRRSPLHEP